jgi:hypothetical protein
VVTRLILLIILGFVAALYFPDSREMMIEEVMPVIQPMLVWNAEREMDALARSVQREARESYQLPATRNWSAWLVANFTGDAATDPWGKTYSYQAWADSFAIRSDGPDDILYSWQRPF